MDVAQFLDFMLGSSVVGSNKPLEQARIALLDKANEDIRDAIEQTLPVIYLVKPYSMVNNILVALNKMDEVELNTYINKIYTPNGILTPLDENFDTYFDEYYNEAVADINTVIEQILVALKARINKEITIKKLGDEVTKINEIVVAANNAYSATLSLGPPQSVSAVTEVLRTEIIAAGSKLRTYLKNSTPAVFTDANEILFKFNAKQEILCVGATFSGLTNVVNETALPIVKAWFEKHKIVISSKLKIGQFTAAGHVAVVKKSIDNEEVVTEIVGINTPLTQATLLYANQQAKTNITMNTFILNSTHIDCALEINKDVDSVKGLLSLNFSFLISQETEFNSVTLRMAEVKAMDNIVKQAFNTTRATLKANFLKTLVSKKGLNYLVSFLKFSPTLEESIVLQVLSPLKGEKGFKLSAVGKTKNKGTSNSTGVFKNKIKNVINKVNSPSTGKKKVVSPIRNIQGRFTSLASLQTLLNLALAQQIQQNMGTGTRRDVLNYRSGRFAESAQVTSMSQSREGMITAYYTYMRNPYATFSEGGAQSSPKTRDPKLLISKSIREVLSTQVNNRLRAVLA